MNEQPTDPLIGRLLDGRYQIRSRIARGGMATVYVATDLRLERRVAVKIMHGHLADDAQFTQRFIQEARSAARLAHPNVVNVFDQGQDGDQAYLVMEYLPGITLRDLLREHRILTSEQTIDILEAVLSGLAAAHKAGIVHRDLKPENVLLADDGRIKIGDFGLARAASANTATGAALLGTIAYLSPELVTRGVADTRSDIYAVGIMMYEMLAGEQPFKGAQPMQIAYQHANDSVPPPSGKNPRVPAELDELVLWATARDPDERPRDARALLDQLADTQQQLSTAIPTVALATAKTMVMPPAMATADTDAATQVLGSARAAESGPIGTAATTELTRTTNRRRTRGRWLVALVLVLAGLAAGTGWYFGPGPGGHVTVPGSIAGATVANATATLEEAGLAVADTTVGAYSLEVAKGAVISSDPDSGASVVRGTIVTLTVSKGPQTVTLPALAGSSVDRATTAIEKLDLVRDTSKDTSRFTASPAYPKDAVIRAYGIDPKTGDQITLSKGTKYQAGSPVFFDVSLGLLPDVTGKTYDEAAAILTAAHLVPQQGAAQFSDTIDKDRAISVSAVKVKQPIRPGDSVIVLMSKGPDVVAIPNEVIGASYATAKANLEAAGFTISSVQSGVDPMLWNAPAVVVAAVYDEDGKQLAAGELIARGSAVKLELNF